MAQKISFQTVLDALLETKKDFPRRHLKYFSDMEPAALKSFLEIWPRVHPTRKLLLLNRLLSLLEEDTLVSFDDLGRALLTDANPEVRALAIRLLAECDDPKLIPAYINILKNDPDLAPRLEAATMLGEFVLLGELEKLPTDKLSASENTLLAIENSEEPSALRRRALESLGYSSRLEVQTLINSAFQREDPEWVASALFAMGRSNYERWSDQVISMLIHVDERIRLAAVQAAGELSLAEARPILLKLLDDEEDDLITEAAIWSLSEIGGEDVREVLESLLDQVADEDEDQIEFLQDALDNLTFTEDMEKFDLLALDTDYDFLKDEDSH